jgi:hypothetical protein
MSDRSPLPIIAEARPEDAPAIAAIHLTSRQKAMPYLQSAHTDDETRDHFARVVGDRPQAWWVVRHQEQIVAYMLIYGEDLGFCRKVGFLLRLPNTNPLNITRLLVSTSAIN